MIQSIVALIDFSDLTRKVIDFSAEQAKAFNAKLILLHIEPEAAEKLYHKIDQGERDRRAHMLHFEHSDLQAKAEELRQLGIEVCPKLLEGPAAETILKEIETIQPGMIVLGNHHHKFFHNLLVGSISNEIINKTKCPLTLIS